MRKEWRVRTFRSGNSVAFRLPKALGIVEGEELMMVPHEDGSLSFWRTSDNLERLLSLQGSFSPGFMKGGRGDVEQEERDWPSAPSHDRAA